MKQVILDEFCTNSGYNRKYAIRLLNGPPPEKKPRPRRRRSASYGAGLIRLLAAVLGAAGAPLFACLKGRPPPLLPPRGKTIFFDGGEEKKPLRARVPARGPGLYGKK